MLQYNDLTCPCGLHFVCACGCCSGDPGVGTGDGPEAERDEGPEAETGEGRDPAAPARAEKLMKSEQIVWI